MSNSLEAVEKSRIGFIGGGKMGLALMQGFFHSGVYKMSDFIVFDRNPSDDLRKTGAFLATSFNEVFDNASTVIIAIKPKDALAFWNTQCSRHTYEKTNLVISVCAGLTSSLITKSNVQDASKVTFAMPSLLCSIGKGSIAIHGLYDSVEPALAQTKALFELCGNVHIVREAHMSAITALSASVPAFISVFLESLSDAGVFEGLSRELSSSLASETLLGTAEYLSRAEVSTLSFRNSIASPGGTTISGIHSLEQNRFRFAVMDAVASASAKAKSIGIDLAKKTDP